MTATLPVGGPRNPDNQALFAASGQAKWGWA